MNKSDVNSADFAISHYYAGIDFELFQIKASMNIQGERCSLNGISMTFRNKMTGEQK